MTILAGLSLIAMMLVLAAVPSASVALVVTRSATLGFKNGAAVTAGIVMGDLVFVTLAILGMSILAETMGTLFALFKYVGGIYLIWLGIKLLRSPATVNLDIVDSRRSTLLASFAAGFLLTLGDVKAILFYASLFPTFVNMADLSAAAIVTIVLVTILTVGSVKLIYAFTARRIVARLRTQRTQKYAQLAAGSLMVGAGTYLIAKA